MARSRGRTPRNRAETVRGCARGAGHRRRDRCPRHAAGHVAATGKGEAPPPRNAIRKTRRGNFAEDIFRAGSVPADGRRPVLTKLSFPSLILLPRLPGLAQQVHFAGTPETTMSSCFFFWDVRQNCMVQTAPHVATCLEETLASREACRLADCLLHQKEDSLSHQTCGRCMEY